MARDSKRIGTATRPSDPPETPVGGRPDEAGQTIAAEDARQGEIILRTKRRRIIFVAGLVLFVLLVVFLRMAAYV